MTNEVNEILQPHVSETAQEDPQKDFTNPEMVDLIHSGDLKPTGIENLTVTPIDETTSSQTLTVETTPTASEQPATSPTETPVEAPQTTERGETPAYQPVDELPYTHDEDEPTPFTITEGKDGVEVIKDDSLFYSEETAPEEEPKPKEEELPKEEKKALTTIDVLDKVNEIVRKTNLSNGDAPEVGYWTLTEASVGKYVPTSKPYKLHVRRPVLHDIKKLDIEKPEDVDLMRDAVAIPTDSPENFLLYLTENPSNLQKPKETEVEVGIMSDGRELMGPDLQYATGALNEESTEIHPVLEIPGTKQRTSSKKASMLRKEGKLSGVEARAAISDSFGIKNHFIVVLPHSGIVAIISAPNMTDLIDLQESIDSAKINIGRNYGGSVYGETTWYINNKLVDFFISRIVKTNLKDSDPENIRQLITPLDIQSIAYGLGASIYPDGHLFTRVGRVEGGRTEIIAGKLRVNEMEFYLESRFSIRQKQFLISAETTKSSNEEIMAYRRNWKAEDEVQPHEFKIKDLEVTIGGKKIRRETWFVLENCSIDDYVKDASFWDAYLKDAMNEVLSMEQNENLRTRFMGRKIASTSLRDYGHFIRQIVLRDHYVETGEVKENIIDDREVIYDTLDSVVVDAKVVEEIRKGVKQFINDSLMVIYGVPTISQYEEEQLKEEVTNALLPINMVTLFFTMNDRTYRKLGI